MNILSRFQAFSADPADQSGVATFAFNGHQVNVPIASFAHAQQLESFITLVAKDSAKHARAAVAAAVRGQLNTLERND